MIVVLSKDKKIKIAWRHARYPKPGRVIYGKVRIIAETTCFIRSEEDDVYECSGNSYCSADDNFSYSKGREVALGRAMAEFNLSKKDRRKVWHNLTSVKKRMGRC